MRSSWRALPASAVDAAGALLRIDAGPGIVAACTSRLGGRSTGELASLNLSSRSTDPVGTVEANRARVLRGLAAADAAWVQGEQVHAAGVAVIDAASEPVITGADALITERTGIALAVLVADCVPILLVDRVTPRIGVVHAGWRGLAAGVVDATIARMATPGIAAFIGPSIGPCCFEVGDEVADAMCEAFDPSVRRDRSPRAHVDLWRASTLALRRSGITEIGMAAACTRCEPHRWFSHRAGSSGRQALVAVIRDRSAPTDDDP